jgi:hypothetical protein
MLPGDDIAAAVGPFIRQHWAGGIGDPDVSQQDIWDVIDSIYLAQRVGPAWQRHAVLEVEDNYALWISGSRNGALLWVRLDGNVQCLGFDGQTTEDLAAWASSIIQVPVGRAGDAARAMLAVYQK